MTNAQPKMLTHDEIERKLAEYRAKLEAPAIAKHKATLEEKLEKAAERLNKVQVRLASSDRHRAAILLVEAKLHLQLDDLSQVYACALELAYLCKVSVLGIKAAYPIEATYPPLPPTIPPPRLVEPPDGDE